MNGTLLTLIDVGAAEQMQPRWARVASYLNYIGFEPDLRSREDLLGTNQGCDSYRIVDTALSDLSGTLRLNLCRKPTVSSSLDPNVAWLERLPDVSRFDVLETVELPVTTLDSLEFEAGDFVKLDVQGGERAVLEGGLGLLAGCVGVEVEVEFTSMYRAQPLFGDVCELLEGQGLEFVDFVSLNRWGRFALDGYGQAVFGDALFLRPPEEFAVSGASSYDRQRYIGVCLLYNRFDLIQRLLDRWEGPALSPTIVEAVASLKLRFDRARRFTSWSQRAASYRLGTEFELHLFY
jgi:FkbM family methyltransferase